MNQAFWKEQNFSQMKEEKNILVKHVAGKHLWISV